MSINRLKIGLALSGGSGRAIAHIGVLEVLKEHDIPVDYITACSSGTLVAASYACGTMQILKDDWRQLNKGFLLSLFAIDKSGKGFFSTEKAETWGRKYMGYSKFEELKPHLGFVCADIVTGESILLSLGDLARAVRAGCSVPGLFEPVEWGNKLLIDGGLFSIIPTAEAKQMGADVVIGVDIAATRYMFSKKLTVARKGYNFLKRSFPVQLYTRLHGLLDHLFTKSIDLFFYNQSDAFEEGDLAEPGMFSILGKAIDISIAQSEKRKNYLSDCDYLISPEVKHLGKADFESAGQMLEEGRRAALAAVPEIKRLLRDYEWRKEAGKKLKFRHV